MTPQELYDRMASATNIDESQYVNVMNRHEAGITELKSFMKKVEPFLKQLKGDLARSLSTKQRNMQSYAKMAKQLGDYEDLNQVQYAELDVN